MRRSLILFVVSVFILTGCGLETKRLSEFYKGDISDVNKIEIVDGSTGSSLTVTEPEAVHNFIEETKHVEFVPLEDQSPRDGFRYSINSFEGDTETFSFGLSQIGDVYYSTEPDIHPIVKEFYKKNNTN